MTGLALQSIQLTAALPECIDVIGPPRRSVLDVIELPEAIGCLR